MAFTWRVADLARTSSVSSVAGQESGVKRQESSICFLGCRIDDVTLDEAVEMSRQAIRKRQRLQHNDVNVAKFISIQHDPDLRRFVDESDLICADGMGIVWGCRILGLALRQRATGCDLMMRLIDQCAREGYRPYFLGATQDVLNEAVARARRDHPGLVVAGSHHGYFDRDAEAEIVAKIRTSRADCLFVGISSPIKERFLNKYRDVLDVPVQVGVGGSFDVLAGRVARAPLWMQRCGLEWLFRLVQEPSRLWRRYLLANTMFAVIMVKALISQSGRRLFAQLRSIS